MDFLALPRRDLQALCKRNGVRANMTNVAMAEALAALPAVDGIEKYVKVPVAVPAPEGKAAATAAAEQQREKQGSPLPRGRRVTVKAVDVKEAEKREPAMEDPLALGVGRRGPSRRARPAPVVATPVVEPVGKAEEKLDGSNEEDQRSEENKEDAPAPVVGRRGASRRARPAPAAVSAGAGAGEESEIDGTQVPRGRCVPVKSSKPIRSEDCEEEEKEDPNQKASTDDAPALAAGRRGPSRRARPTPALAAPAAAGKVTEQMAPIPRGRHTKAKSTDEGKPGDGEADEKQGTKPEEEEADVSALGVARRGANRRARRSPAVSAPAGKLRAEVITLDDSDEEKEDAKPQEKDDDAPEIGRAPSPEEALATRRSASTTKAEAGNVAVDAVPIRPTRQRKPTMKAAAAAKEKALPKATRRDTGKNTDSQEQQEKTQGTISDAEAVPEPVSNVGCDNPEDSKEVASEPKNTEQKQEDEGLVITEDDILMKETLAQELSFMDQECMDYSTMQEQQVEIEKCPAPFTSQEDSPILGLISMADEQAAEKGEGDNFQDGEGSNEGSLDKGVEEIHDATEELELVPIIQEAVNDDANHKSEMGNLSDLPVLPHGTEEASEVNKEADLLRQEKEDIIIHQVNADLADEAALVDCPGNVNLFAKEDTCEVISEDVFSSQEKGDVAAETQMPLPDNVAEIIPSGCSSAISWVEVEKAGGITSVMPESPVALDITSQEKEDINTDQLQADLAVGSVLVDCSGNVNLFAKEDTNEVNNEDVLSCQEGDVDDEMTLPDTVAEVIPSGCSSGISWVEVVEAGDITSDIPESPVALDITSPEKKDINIDLGSVLVDCSGNVNLFTKEDTSEVNTEYGFSCHEKVNTDVVHANELKQVVTTDQVAQLKGTEGDVLKEVNTEDITSQEKEDINTDQLQADLAVGSVLVDCSGNVNLFAKEDTNEVNTEDVLSCQEGDVDDEMTLPDTVAEVIPSGCSSGISWVEVVEARDITSDIPESPVALDITSLENKEINIDLGSVLVDCSGNVNLFTKEDTSEVNTEYGFSCHEKVNTDVVHANELKQVVTTDQVAQLKGTEGDVLKEDKAGAITGEVPNSTGVMDGCVQIGFVLDELINAITTDNMPAVTGADGNTKNTFTSDLPQELNVAEESDDHINPALHADVTEYLTKSIITMEPAVSASEATSVCTNSSEKKAAETVAMLKEKGFKGTKKSEDLSKLSLGQLRTKLKETLNAKKSKEAKRVALARMDENVCRSRAKGQQQNLNLQQH